MFETQEINHIRTNLLTGKRVIIGRRMGKVHNHNYTYAPCQFCPESINKEKEITRYPYGGINIPWEIIVVPSKYPIFGIDGNLDRRAEGMFDIMNAIGANEVVIETPHHKNKFADLSTENIEMVLNIWQWRIEDLKKDRCFRYIFIYKNEDTEEHIQHTHSQIIATPFIPHRVKEKLEKMKEYFERKERCLLCDIIAQELKDKIRVVEENYNYLAIEPFASLFPYETHIMPKKHNCSFENEKNGIKDLAIIMKNIIKRMEEKLNPEYDPLSYTLCFYTTPNENSFSDEEKEKNNIKNDFHWHIIIIPKIKKLSSFEKMTGIHTNHISPEKAAEDLRNAKI